MKIILGVAGTSGLGYENAFKQCAETDIGALEVEFTYGVRMPIEDAKLIGELAKKNNVALSVHAPYYINLVSKEKQKIGASRTRILQSCERAHYLGASPIVFHAGFYMGRDPSTIYDSIKEQIEKLHDAIKENGWEVQLAPEVTGKPTQFGNLEELQRLSKETGCTYCIDFSHMLARNGSIDYNDVVSRLPNSRIHAHFSGIEFTEKGERRHLLVSMDEWKKLYTELQRQKKDIRIICESPDPFADVERMLSII